jgi:PadR family transcriptional regulator, regulatory protein PadR
VPTEAAFDASQLLKGALDLVVLAVLDREENYGYEIARRIWSGGLADVREASVYGTLSRLFRSGMLTARVVASDAGPDRKYYGVSPQGRAYLADGRQRWTTTRTAIDCLLDPATPEGPS